MDKRLLDYDPLTGLMTWHSYDPLTDGTVVSYSADSTPVIEVNKKLANDTDFSRQGIKDEMWHYAQIPVMVQLDWLINKGVDVYRKEDAKKVFQLLNDPEYRYLKTTSKYHRPKQ